LLPRRSLAEGATKPSNLSSNKARPNACERDSSPWAFTLSQSSSNSSSAEGHESSLKRERRETIDLSLTSSSIKTRGLFLGMMPYREKLCYASLRAMSSVEDAYTALAVPFRIQRLPFIMVPSPVVKYSGRAHLGSTQRNTGLLQLWRFLELWVFNSSLSRRNRG